MRHPRVRRDLKFVTGGLMTYETLIFDRTDTVATLTINRPAKLNALS